jgi:hypothetical protein
MLPLGELIGAGVRSKVFAMGDGLVVKVPRPSTPDAWIRHEADYSRAVRALGLPVPAVHELTHHDGRLVVVYERIDGPSMWTSICDQPATAAAMGELLAGLHLQVFDSPVPMSLPRQRDRLMCKINAARSHLGDEVEIARALLPAGSPPLRLCHGDVHPGNVIMSAAGPVLLDWFDAARGDALADVARSSILMGGGGRADSSLPHLVPLDRGVVRSLHDSYMRVLRERLTSFDEVDFAAWTRVEAAARLAEGVPPHDLLALWRATD